MTELDLEDRLQRTADDVAVGPPPLAAVLAGGRRRRRRRRAVQGFGGLAAVAAVVSVGTGLPPVEAPEPPPEAASATVPGHGRLLGLDGVAALVPDEWSVSSAACHGAVADRTVIIDVDPDPACVGVVTGEPADVIAIERIPADTVRAAGGASDVLSAPARSPSTTSVDGKSALLEPISCTTENGVAVCEATLVFRDPDVAYTARSSDGPAGVRRLLSWARVVPDGVAVPLPDPAGYGGPYARVERFLRLRDEGIDVRVTTRSVRWGATSEVVRVAPAPGTLLAPGDRVDVVIGVEGPASHASVSGTLTRGSTLRSRLDDDEIREDPTLLMRVGDVLRLRTSGTGRDEVVVGRTGIGLNLLGAPPTTPGGVRDLGTFEAVEPGRSTLTVSVREPDGEPDVLGVLTVEVAR